MDTRPANAAALPDQAFDTSKTMMRWLAAVFIAFVVLTTLGRSSRAQPSQHLPEVRIENVRRIPHNGEHNAFTDLIQWRGKFWLTFRSCPDGHLVFGSSSIVIMSSDDTQTWKLEHQFSVPLRDTRDPHFLDFKGKLFVLTGTWYSGPGELPRDEYDLNKHLGFAVWTDTGQRWFGPRQLEGTYGHYIWRATSDGNTAFLCGRRKKGFSEIESGAGGAEIVESALLESTDGLNWSYRSLFQQERGNETAFQILPDESMLAVSRERGSQTQLARAKPPYRDWTRKTLPVFVGGPMLMAWGKHWLVGGRRVTATGPQTALYWLEEDQLKLAGLLPSGGDNSYPGFVSRDQRSGVVSWYSSHEVDQQGVPITAVYLADVTKVQTGQ